MPYAWPELDYLAALYFALAVCFAIIIVVKAFFGVTSHTIGKLPIIGGWIDAEGQKIQNKIVNLFGGYAANIEGRIGTAWHSVARLVDWLGREIHAHAALLALLAQNAPGLQAFGNALKQILALDKRVKQAQADAVGIGHDVFPRIKTVERGIGNDVLPLLRSLDREIGRVVTKDTAALWHRTGALEADYHRLLRWMRTRTRTVVDKAFVGAVAIALARLGLGWLRCPSLGKLGKRIGCGGFGLLDELFAASFVAFAAADICTFANVAMGTAELLRPALLELVDVEDALVGCHGATGVRPLHTTALRLPPNSLNLPLAA